VMSRHLEERAVRARKISAKKMTRDPNLILESSHAFAEHSPK
jgi:hypothetical protein